MAYKALKANGLSFELIRAEDIKRDALKIMRCSLFPEAGHRINLKPSAVKALMK